MRTGPSKNKAAQKKKNGDKLADSVDKLSVENTPKVKSKNLNVVEEFKKSGMKRMANFVVIGELKDSIARRCTHIDRTRGSWQEYTHGSLALRSESN